MRRTLLVSSLLCIARLAVAYEGAARSGDQPEPEAPKVPVLTKPPTLVERSEPAYPEHLLKAGIGGQVALLIDIDVDGAVSRAEVLRSSGQEALDGAAVRALVLFRFTPAEFDNVPALVRVEYLQNFEARPPEPPPPDAPPPPAQVNLKGRVLERGTRDPVEGAVVYLPEHELVATTGPDGRFEVRGVPDGKVKIEISDTKHRKFETTDEVRPGEATELTAYLWKRIESGFEVTVRGEREKKEVARRTLQQDELKSVPGTFGDPVRVIQNLPGMARAPFVAGALLVRGAQPQDTGVYVDGVPVPILYHFAGGPSVLNPAFIDRIDFFPGAYGSKYGRAIAGILDVTTRSSAPKRLHGQFDIDFLDAGFFLEGPVKEGADLGTWAVAARRSYIDAFLPTILDLARPAGSASIVAAPRYWDYQARWERSFGKHHLDVLLFGSDDVLTVAQAGDAESQGFSVGSHQGFHRLRVGYSHLFENGWQVKAAPTIGYSVQSFNFSDAIAGDLSWTNANLRTSIGKEFSKSLSFEAGLELNRLFYDVSLKVPEPPRFITFPGQAVDTPIVERVNELQAGAMAAHAEAVWNPFGGLRLVPGVRVELYDLPKGLRPSVEPRLAARYDISSRTAVKAAWGIFRQNPQPQDMDEQFGNPWLQLPTSQQTVAGFEQRFSGTLLLDVQGFYNRRTNLVVGSSDVVVQDGVSRIENLNNDGYGRSYGLEVLLKQDLTERMYGWIAYTLSRSEQWSERREKYIPVNFDQTHLLTIVGSYKWDFGIETGLRFRMTTGRPDTEILGASYDADTNSYRPIRSDAGSVRGPTFHQLDLRIEKLWTYEQWKLSAYLDIQNVYNAENPEFVLSDYRFREQATVRGLPFLPTLGVTGSF